MHLDIQKQYNLSELLTNESYDPRQPPQEEKRVHSIYMNLMQGEIERERVLMRNYIGSIKDTTNKSEMAL